MGMLVDGVWHADGRAATRGGRFERAQAGFRNCVTADGAPGPSGEGGFAAEPGRYRLYVAHACPWAHRTLILRALKRLEEAIPVSAVHWLMLDQGWTFEPGPGVVPDPDGARFLHEVYARADPRYTGRATTPVLWDTRRRTIVSNESSEIIRMFNAAFDGVGAAPGDYYPPPLRAEIGALNERIYATLNNGVYRAGFATTQAAYEEAVRPLFETLAWLEARLGDGRRWLCGDAATEADWRLLPTLLRFDLVYHGHFKCNLRRLAEHPRLWAYTRRLLAVPGVAATWRPDHAKRHYYESHRSINPTGIVPAGPEIDWAPEPEDRAAPA